MKFLKYLLFFVPYIFFGCTDEADNKENDVKKVVLNQKVDDSHSFSNIKEISTEHLHLELDVNFDSKIIYGVARHTMNNSGTDTAIFDVKGINIQKVTLGEKGSEQNTDYIVGTIDSILGAPLAVKITPTTKNINIYYNTTENSDALDWLPASLTEGKKHPYLYTQGQAILTRTWIPIQDTPANKITYSADVKVPKELMALMSARNPKQKSEDGKYYFEMKQAIAPYLIALAVGNLEYRMLSGKCGVYSEPKILRKSAWEFTDLPKMLSVAERIYGKYEWGQFDVLVMPYSFPFGGMENPRLTFVNPTIITGDRSLTSVIAHELAHSWSGNLVTNATWEDFWLNEGFTVYFEHRIMEALYGEETANMLSIIEFQELKRELNYIETSKFPEDSQLKLDLKHRHPDMGMTTVAYVKGAYFLKTLEKLVGRETFDEFIKRYFDYFKFSSLTTETFEEYLNENLLLPNNITFNTTDWLYKSNLPENAIKIESRRLFESRKLSQDFAKGIDIFSKKYNKKRKNKELTRQSLTTQEWLTFLRNLPKDIEVQKLEEIDRKLSFKTWKNSEVATEWYLIAIDRNYKDVFPNMERFLSRVGRLKYIEPIYSALVKDVENKKWAREVFEKVKQNYHPIAILSVDSITKN